MLLWYCLYALNNSNFFYKQSLGLIIHFITKITTCLLSSIMQTSGFWSFIYLTFHFNFFIFTSTYTPCADWPGANLQYIIMMTWYYSLYQLSIFCNSKYITLWRSVYENINAPFLYINLIFFLTDLTVTGAFRRVCMRWCALEDQWGSCGKIWRLAESMRKSMSTSTISRKTVAEVVPTTIIVYDLPF